MGNGIRKRKRMLMRKVNGERDEKEKENEKGERATGWERERKRE
jgi:hypothetical protein